MRRRQRKKLIPLSVRLREDQVAWLHRHTVPGKRSDSAFLRECIDKSMRDEEWHLEVYSQKADMEAQDAA